MEREPIRLVLRHNRTARSTPPPKASSSSSSSLSSSSSSLAIVRNITRLTADFQSQVVPPVIHVYKPSYRKKADQATMGHIAVIDINKLLPPLDMARHNQTYPKVYAKKELFHIIKTRFMQHQPRLLELGKARLELFKTFCLPSMLHQTTQNFVWIIYTDPDLDAYLLQEMKVLLAPYPHFYLLPALMDKRGQGGKDILRHFAPTDFLMGDVNMLYANLRQVHWLAVLESRFDADDALNIGFVEEVQKRGRKVFLEEEEDGRDWMYWCINQAAEWHWVGPGNRPSLQTYGALVTSRNYADDKFCHTPGLTIGVKRGSYTRSLVKAPHHMLYERLTLEDISCGASYRGEDCLDFVDNFDECALRSRTPTSASMADVNSLGQRLTKAAAEDAVPRWEHVIRDFALLPENAKATNEYLEKHMKLILQDAVLGQCTVGHSCRPDAQQELTELIEKVSGEDIEDVEVGV
eukprot:scaffold8681_cov200-Amphora_coffeaeformis.AAC.12